MRSSLFLSIVSLLTVPNSIAQSTTDAVSRAEFAFSALQIWYDAGSGLYRTTGWWNNANIITMIGNLAKYDPDNEKLVDLVKRVYVNTIEQAPEHNPQPGIEAYPTPDHDSDEGFDDEFNEDFDEEFDADEGTGFDSDPDSSRRRKRKNVYHTVQLTPTGYYKAIIGEDHEFFTHYPEGWDSVKLVDFSNLPINRLADQGGTELLNTPSPEDWLDGFYDDDLWWALAWINAYDVTNIDEYLHLAEGIFMAVTKSWPTRCGNGGIFWSWEEEYMNAIANELFISTAAHLANRAENATLYRDWARRGLEWFTDSGMINERGTINDGLTEDCQNNNETVWSYNQGVILGGLVELARADPDSYDSYISLADRIAKAAIAELSDENGVIHDECGNHCGADGTQFKGIFARNLQLLHEEAPDDAYIDCIQANAESIWENNRDEGYRLSINWAGPFIAPANASTHSSAMEALVAAITVQ